MRFSAGKSDDAERLARFMNAKQRLFGVDVEALNGQLEAKRQAKQQEKALDESFAASSATTIGMLTMTQLDAAARRRDWNKEVAQFRTTNQGKPTTREWDLNRPDARRLQEPARLGDADPRCGRASLQTFAGEDLTMGSRVAAQMQQCRMWWDEQTAEAEHQRKCQQLEKRQLAAAATHLDALQLSLREQEAAGRAQLEAQAAVENSALRSTKAAREQAAKEAEAQAALAELAAAAADPWLNEHPGQAASALSPARVRKDHWKGMSREQVAAITQQQAAQVEQKRAAVAAAAAAEAASASQGRAVQRAVLLQAQGAEQARRSQALASAADLREQMAAKAARDAALKEAYANKVTGDFFAQFGTSAR